MKLSTLLVTAAAATLLAGSAFAQPPEGGPPPGGGRGGPPPTADDFAKADTNKDGKLDLAEYTKSLPEARQANAGMAFMRRDANMDGSLSKEEFLAAPQGRGGGGGGGRGGPPPAG